MSSNLRSIRMKPTAFRGLGRMYRGPEFCGEREIQKFSSDLKGWLKPCITRQSEDRKFSFYRFSCNGTNSLFSETSCEFCFDDGS